MREKGNVTLRGFKNLQNGFNPKIKKNAQRSRKTQSGAMMVTGLQFNKVEKDRQKD